MILLNYYFLFVIIIIKIYKIASVRVLFLYYMKNRFSINNMDYFAIYSLVFKKGRNSLMKNIVEVVNKT